MDAYGPSQDERYLESSSDPDLLEEGKRERTHLSSCGFHLPVDVFDRKFYGNHHHPPTAGPVNNRPGVHAIQDKPRNISVWSPGYTHIIFGVYETYIRVPVHGFACSQEVNDLADGPIDQFSTNEILRFLFVGLSSAGYLESTLP